MIICFPHKPGAGGPGSFQSRIERELHKKGVGVVYKGSQTLPDVILVVGGTRHLLWLILMRIKGISVIFRLDGIGWLHRKKKVGIKYYLIAECRNLLNKIIHAYVADTIVYQSQFVKDWWDEKGWRKRKNTAIIYNGAEIPGQSSDSVLPCFSGRLVILEGNIDYSPYAVRLINDLAERLKTDISISLYGSFENTSNISKLNKRIQYFGFLPREKVYEVLPDSVYLSLDIHPACPNTVIEALACGAPVAGFDTGSLKELVPANAGEIVPYGSDPWRLAYPDVSVLVDGIMKIKHNYASYAINARKTAVDRYSVNKMTDCYLHIINPLIHGRE